MKRLICAMLVVVLLSMVPIVMAGCEKPTRDIEIGTKVDAKTEPETKAPTGPKIIVE